LVNNKRRATKRPFGSQSIILMRLSFRISPVEDGHEQVNDHRIRAIPIMIRIISPPDPGTFPGTQRKRSNRSSRKRKKILHHGPPMRRSRMARLKVNVVPGPQRGGRRSPLRGPPGSPGNAETQPDAALRGPAGKNLEELFKDPLLVFLGDPAPSSGRRNQTLPPSFLPSPAGAATGEYLMASGEKVGDTYTMRERRRATMAGRRAGRFRSDPLVWPGAGAGRRFLHRSPGGPRYAQLGATRLQPRDVQEGHR